ncbi:22733_t:CDS:2, partial [Gigaspora rosea]
AVESLKEAALETFTYNETTTATTQPLSWDAQVNKDNTLLKDITNEMCTERSNYVEEKSELKEEQRTRRIWNASSLGLTTEKEDEEVHLPSDNDMIDHESIKSHSEQTDKDGTNNDMQIDKSNVTPPEEPIDGKPFEKLTEEKETITPQLLITSPVDELATLGYTNTEQTMDPPAAEDTEIASDANPPENGTENADAFTRGGQRSQIVKPTNQSRIMPRDINIKIASLNVKGLNNRGKQTNTITLLKTYKLDIIVLQETNLNNRDTIDQIKFQWGFNSVWTNKCAILAGNKYIKFTNVTRSAEGRVMEAEFLYKDQNFHIINVYAPPNIQERTKFFDNWAPSLKEGTINILAGDFNTNINPEVNHISHSAFQNDPSRQQLRELTKDFIDASEMTGESPFLTYFQNTQMGRSMATCIDYIFIEAEYSHLFKKLILRHVKEVTEELTDKVTPEDWDLCKLRIQSIIRAFKKPKALEGRIAQLNRNLTKLKAALREELDQLSETWRKKSKARWIEKGERSTKYFYTRYKARMTSNCQDRIKIPEDSEFRNNLLQYIKMFYKALYKSEAPEERAIKNITSDLPQVNLEGNASLVKEISEEEIRNTIRSLAYNKSPGSDGLTH